MIGRNPSVGNPEAGERTFLYSGSGNTCTFHWNQKFQLKNGTSIGSPKLRVQTPSTSTTCAVSASALEAPFLTGTHCGMTRIARGKIFRPRIPKKVLRT